MKLTMLVLTVTLFTVVVPIASHSAENERAASAQQPSQEKVTYERTMEERLAKLAGGVAKINVGKRTFFWIVSHRTIDFLRMFFWM